MNLEAALLAAANALPMDRDRILRARANPREMLPVLGIETAKRLLCWLLCYRESIAETLVLQWHHRSDGRDVLRGIFGVELPVSARKRLESVLLTELETKRRLEAGVLPAGGFSSETMGFLSSFDPLGARWIFVIDESAKTPTFFEIKLTENEILSFDVRSVGSVEQVIEYLRGVTRRERLDIVDASRESLAVLLARAIDEPPVSEKLAQTIAKHAALLAEPPLEACSPGALVREAFLEVPRAEAIEQIAKWVLERKIGPWPPRSAVIEFADHLLKPFLQIRGLPSPPPVPNSVRNELGSLLFDWNGSERWRNRLEETAYVFWKLRREEDARACLSAAASLREPPGPDHPLIKAGLTVLFGPLLKR